MSFTSEKKYPGAIASDRQDLSIRIKADIREDNKPDCILKRYNIQLISITHKSREIQLVKTKKHCEIYKTTSGKRS